MNRRNRRKPLEHFNNRKMRAEQKRRLWDKGVTSYELTPEERQKIEEHNAMWRAVDAKRRSNQTN